MRLKSRQIREQMVELERSRAALHEEATHDPLTGLANRRLFYDRLQQAIRHAHRYGGKVGILYVDLDRFKDINDQHGHHVGDAVLTEVAKRLTSSIRDSDSVARLGGDEFVVLLEGVQGREDCLAAAHKIEQALNADTTFLRTRCGNRCQHRPGAVSRRRRRRRRPDSRRRRRHVPDQIRQRVGAASSRLPFQ